MPVHLHLSVAADLCRAALADEPGRVLAATALAGLPALEELRRQPYDAGLKLFEALGGPALWARLEQTPDRVLLLECDDAADALAWEYAALPERRLLGCAAGLLRLLPRPAAPPPDPAPPPRLLLLHADPLVRGGGAPPCAPDCSAEQALLRQALGRLERALTVRRLPPTAAHLADALADGPALLHLSCHGALVPAGAGQDVSLLLEDDCGAAAPLLGRDLLDALPPGRLRAVLLSACRSAPLARALVRAGAPLALGMQQAPPDSHGPALAAAFWRWLAAGSSPAEAARQARRASAAHDAGAVGLLVAYIAGAPWGALQVPPGRADLQLDLPMQLRLPENLIPPAEGLLGRDAELAALARAFARGAPVVTLSGAGGMGKTALAAAFARRFGWRFGRVLGVSFANRPPDADTVCRTLLEQAGCGPQVQAVLAGTDRGQRLVALRQSLEERETMAASYGLLRPLGLVNDINQLRGQIAELEGPDLAAQTGAQLRALLREVLRPDDLVLLDNCESLLTPETGQERGAERVRQLLPLLRDTGARLLLTSRARPAGLPGEVLVPPQGGLAGLAPDDGAALFLRYATRSRDGRDDQADRALARELSGLTGGYPLALTLLGSAYDLCGAMPREQFVRHWVDRLVQARQRYGDPRHAGFGPAVELSLRPLEPDLRARLLALSLYEMPFFAEGAALLWGLPCDQHGAPTEAALAETDAALAELTRRSLLEVVGYVEDTGTPAIYHFQPALRQELRRRAPDGGALPPGALAYGGWIARFGSARYRLSPLLAQVVVHSQTLLDAAAAVLTGEAQLWHIRNVAWLRRQFGELLAARQALEAALPRTPERSQIRSSYLYDLACLDQIQGALDQALARYRACLELKDALGDVRGQAATLHELASVHQVRGELAEAVRLYDQSLELKEQLGDLRGKASTLHALAYIHQLQGRSDQAMRLYRESLRLKELDQDRHGIAATLHELAYVHRLHGECDEAMRLYRSSLEHREALRDVRGEAATLHAMASIAWAQGDPQQAVRLYRKSLALRETLQDRLGIAATLHELASIARVQGQPEEAMRLYAQSLELREGLQDVQGKAATLHALAYIHQIHGEYAQAMRLYRQSLELKETLQDIGGKAATLHELASIYRVLGRLSEAMQLYRESFELRAMLQDVQGQGSTLHAIAQIHQLRKQYDQAMALYRESLALKEVFRDAGGKAATLHEMACIYRTHGQLEQARPLYHESLRLRELIQDAQGRATTLHELANTYQAQGQLEQAARLYDESLAIKERLQDVRGKAETLGALAYVRLAQGDVQEALRLQAECLALGRAAGARPTLDEAIGVWVQADDPERRERLPSLLGAVLREVAAARGAADVQADQELAESLIALRVGLRHWPPAEGLPPFGVFLGCLQALLRGQADQLARLRARLDPGLARALAQLEALGAAARPLVAIRHD